MQRVIYIIVFVSLTLLFYSCSKSERKIEYQLPDKVEHPEPGKVEPIEPKAFVDSLNAGVDMDIYFLRNVTPDEQQYMVNVPGMKLIPLGDIFFIAETLSTEKPLYLVCLWGDDSKRAAERIKIQGINSYYLDGGCYRLWKKINENGWILPAQTETEIQR